MKYITQHFKLIPLVQVLNEWHSHCLVSLIFGYHSSTHLNSHCQFCLQKTSTFVLLFIFIAIVFKTTPLTTCLSLLLYSLLLGQANCSCIYSSPSSKGHQEISERDLNMSAPSSNSLQCWWGK